MTTRSKSQRVVAQDCRAPHGGRSASAESEPTSLAKIVAEYRRHHAPRAKQEREYYASLSAAAALNIAAMAARPDGKRHEHQRRIPRRRLALVRARLLRINVSRCASFAELHDGVERALANLPGVGPLFIYDTAMRLGAREGLAPVHIYLHAGTRAGARALLGTPLPCTLSPRQLPVALRGCSAMELEDILCIFKTALQRLMANERSRRGTYESGSR